MDTIFSRQQLLLGSDALEQLRHCRVIVFGVGGVGSWCAEALVRAGVGHITLVDADCVDPTNINRQLPALTTTVGRPKAEVLAERFRLINPEAEIIPVVQFYDADTASQYDFSQYDAVVDAIDSLPSKMLLICRATEARTPLFSSMGAARRLDPGRVQVAEFWKVKGCPLARALRERFKKSERRPTRKFQCVFSDEPPTGQPKGTTMTVTATFGLRLASLALARLTQKPLAKNKRIGWGEAFSRYASEGEDEMLLPDYLDSEVVE